MKKITVTITLLLILMCFQNCKKTLGLPGTNTGGGTTPPLTAYPTAVGTPTGQSISKFIPTSGGSLTSPDGRVELDIPGGSLPNGDTITIENITNNGPGGIGDAYRFSPEGLTFTNPITIKFHCKATDIAGTIPQFLHIAYQESSGVWKLAGQSTLDESSNTVSVTSTHFSDWDIFPDLGIYQIDPINETNGNLRINQTQKFAVKYDGSTDDGELSAPKSVQLQNVSSQIVKNWSVNSTPGGSTDYGRIAADNTISSGNATATYTAPAKVPSSNNPVAISVALQNLGYLDPKFGSFNNLTLTLPVKIIGNDYNFSVIMYYNDKTVDGGLVGLAFAEYDTLTFTVSVKNATDVTVGQIKNFKLHVEPATQTDSYSGCTSTWLSTGDFWDIASGTGTVFELGSGVAPAVQISLVNNQTTIAGFSNTCSGSSIGGYPRGNTQVGLSFSLVDSLQEMTDFNFDTKIVPNN
jgi:hypothetical protein